MTADASFGGRIRRWLRPEGAVAAARSRIADAVTLLEERIMLDADPAVAIHGPATVPLGGAFAVTLTFDNLAPGGGPNDVGYGPYIDLVVPVTGKDGAGAAVDDGISFTSATFLGAPVAATVVTFDASGHATHPFATDASGAPRIVTGTPGDSLVVLRLPFGSFTGDQTPADIKVNLQLSPLALYDPAHITDGLTLSAQGGFYLGTDPADNPAADPPLLQSPPVTLAVSPSLLTLTKTADTPEGESATGPNYPHIYTINLDVAAGQPLSSVHVQDLLPANIVYLGSTVTLGSGSLVTQPDLGVAVDPAHNLLDYSFGSVTGGPGVDAQIKVRFYVADISGAGAPVIDPLSGAATLTLNDVRATGVFTPLDPRHPAIPIVEDASAIDNAIVNRSLAIQKTSAIAVDNNVPGLSPGDVVSYTLNVQLSDYFTAGDIKLGDLLGDGQRIDTSFQPVFTITERGVSTGLQNFAGTVAVGGEFTGGNFVTTFNAVDGTTNVAADLSAEIDARNLFPDGDGVLAGGRTQPGDALALVGATTLSITFRAVVQTSFVAPQPVSQSINQGDRIADRASADATIRDNATLAATGTVGDSSTISKQVASGALQSKELVAVNGTPPELIAGRPQVTQGDTVTFRLRYVLPTSAVDNFALVDYLPLPVLPAPNLVQSASPAGVLPGAGEWNYGAGDTFHTLPGAPVPVVPPANLAGNSESFVYGSYSLQNQPGNPSPQTSLVEILFTVRVVDLPFSDKLLLTNQVSARETNSQGQPVVGSAIVQFDFTQPELTVTKGVVDAKGNNPVTFLGSRGPAGVNFTGATGSTAAAVFTGNITDAALATGAIDANLLGIDAADKVTFAITVNNNGTGRAGAFDVIVRDTLPAGFAIPADATGLNLKVTDGAGNPVAYTLLGGGLFDAGIKLTDGSTGAIARDPDGSAATGTTTGDIVVITYDLVAAPSVQPRQSWTNTATLANYAAYSGGANFVPAGLTDAAVVTTRDPLLAKSVIATSQSFTSGSNLAIGETVTYRVTYSLAEGQTNALRLSDILQNNSAGVLTPLSATLVSVGPGITGPGVLPPGTGRRARRLDLHVQFRRCHGVGGQ